MTRAGPGLLLDTCALIWLGEGKLRQAAVEAMASAAAGMGVFVSPVSAWEVGLLSVAKGSRPALRFVPDPVTWFADVTASRQIRDATLTPEIAIAASYLPGGLHPDPADRLIVATARWLGVPIMTADGKIRAYAADGHVGVVAC